MIDTVTDDLPTIRRTATLLQDIADQREESDTALAESIRNDLNDVPAGTKGVEPEAPPVVDTAAIFGRPSAARLDDGSLAQPAGLDGHGAAPPPPPLPPVIVPPAPPAPLALVPSAGLPVELDSAGIPHDARIHQDSRKKNKDDTWQNRRGLDKTTLAAITAELKFNAQQQQRQPAPPTAPAPPIAPAGVAPPPPPPVTVPVPPVGASGLLPGAAPGGIVGFRELMQKITANTNSGKLTNEQVDAALHSVGLPPRQLIGLVSAPELIPNVTSYIDACLAAA